MNEADDRLAGDPVWEIFSVSAAVPATGSARTRRFGRWLAAAGLIALVWLLSRPLAVVLASVWVAAGDFRRGRHLARSIPDKAGGSICARFSYSWGCWKLGLASFALSFVVLIISAATEARREVPSECFAALLLAMGGILLSAGFTALGLMAALRSGMRIWIGEGVNQARTLILGMLMVVFTFVVLGPLSVWLVTPRGDFVSFLVSCAGWFVGPIVILLVLDWISRRVLADRPGKFGPNVPTVGKWNV
jgi:hypothetical protein